MRNLGAGGGGGGGGIPEGAVSANRALRQATAMSAPDVLLDILWSAPDVLCDLLWRRGSHRNSAGLIACMSSSSSGPRERSAEEATVDALDVPLDRISNDFPERGEISEDFDVSDDRIPDDFADEGLGGVSTS